MITKVDTDQSKHCLEEDSNTSLSSLPPMNSCFKRHKRVLDSDTSQCLCSNISMAKADLSNERKSQKILDRSAMRSRSHFVGIVVLSVLLSFLCQGVSSAASSSVNDCRGVRYAYSAKGLDLKDVPRQPRQGKTQ